MVSALDVVQVCIEWAQAKKILKADPGLGQWSVFSAEDMQKRFAGGHTGFLGAAANLFFFDLKVWAIDGQEVPLIEAQAYADKCQSQGGFEVLRLLGC